MALENGLKQAMGLENKKISLFLKNITSPNLLAHFAYFTGFKVNSGEYKLMGLVPFGVPRHRDPFLSELVDLKDDGSIRLNVSYFYLVSGLPIANRRFAIFIGGPRRAA